MNKKPVIETYGSIPKKKGFGIEVRDKAVLKRNLFYFFIFLLVVGLIVVVASSSGVKDEEELIEHPENTIVKTKAPAEIHEQSSNATNPFQSTEILADKIMSLMVPLVALIMVGSFILSVVGGRK